MLKNWFYRLLLSYLPVFVLIVGFLVLSSVLMLSDMSKRATIKSNEILTRQVLQNIDNVLKALDQAMVREIFAEKGVAEFIRNPSFTAYDAAMRLKGLKEAQDWVDSVYLVREQDGVVVTETRIVSLDTFEDRQYVQQLRESSIAFAWSGVREL
ncbi:MAG: hypothetical protein K0R28_4464, partial [Paenibacillus sp.]|nr:hypothetical protein [Paenibacillus sp.]